MNKVDVNLIKHLAAVLVGVIVAYSQLHLAVKWQDPVYREYAHYTILLVGVFAFLAILKDLMFSEFKDDKPE